MDEVKILVVEDEKLTAEYIKIGLEKSGYQVLDTVDTGKKAIKKVEELSADLVLMDIHLKGDMDGIEAAEVIRNRFGVPVIFLTAYNDEKTIQRAKLTEPSGFLTKEPFRILNKPFVEKELHNTIEITLYRHRIENRLREHERWLIAVLNSISDAVIATDSSKQVKFMNTIAEDLTGWIEADAIGMDIGDIFKIVGNESEFKEIKLMKGSLPIKHDMLISQDSSQNLIDGTITPINNENGEIEGLVVIFRKID
ncbi:MAG: response regulator [Methanobacterium sp.]|nr:response regulator [Methanobacterium sp.]